MMMPTDLELLERYLRGHSEEAFATLVHRHLDLVYSAALRQVRSPQLAEEVAQSVFTDLSKHAARLKLDGPLSAWLYQVTRRTAVDVVRREARRQAREQVAMELNAMDTRPSVWSQIEPLLDEAMDGLETADRNAILMRFFEDRSLREVGEALGLSEDAAQKRVSRAVDRLRAVLSKQGITVGVGGFVAALSAHAVQSAPIGLVTAISTTATASVATLSAATTAGGTKLLAMTTMQKLMIAGSLTVALGVGFYEHQRASQLQRQLQAAQEQQQPFAEQLRQAQQEHADAVARLAAIQQESEQLRLSAAELPRLRSEVGRLRESARESERLKGAATNTSGFDTDPALESAFKTWAARASRVRQRLQQASDQHIPELQLLNERNWFEAVKDLKQLDTDEDFKRAFSQARNVAKGEFGGVLRNALRSFAEANGGQLPTDLAQLKPFLNQTIDDSVFQRYQLLQTGRLDDVPKGAFLVGEVAPLIDEDRDGTFQFSLDGTSSHSGSRYDDMLRDAGIKFAEANNGLLPTDPAQLTPYLQQVVDPARIKQFLNRIPPGVRTLQQLMNN